MSRFYYGWVNVVVAAAGLIGTLPGRTYGLALVKEPLRADLGLSDLRFSALNAWAVILGAALVVPAGRLVDRAGARGTFAGVAALLGLAVLLMSRAADELSFFLALLLVRGLGQAALSAVSVALVGKWFRRRAGAAMGVLSVLLTLGFIGPLVAVGAAVQSGGWRDAWAGLGVALFGLALFGTVFARSSPESYGVPPDEPADELGGGPRFTLFDALRTPAFWAVTLGSACFNGIFSALTLSGESLLTERGLDAAELHTKVMGAMMLAGLPANLLTGWLARSVPLGRLLAAGLMLLLVALALMAKATSAGEVMSYGLFLGASGGVITVVFFAAYGRYFGRAHVGAIVGVAQGATVLASAVGPLALAAVHDGGRASSFPFFAAAGVLTALSAAAALVPPPRREVSP